MPAICSKCGAALPDSSYSFSCVQCGTSLFDSDPALGAPTSSIRSDLEGIGGWLIVAAIGLGLAPLRSIHGIYTDLHVLYGSNFENWLSMHPGIAGLLLFEAVTNTLFLIALASLNYLFYCRKRNFPSLMITFFALHAILILIDHISALHFYANRPSKNVLVAILGAAVWIPYYLISKRVKATFVH